MTTTNDDLLDLSDVVILEELSAKPPAPPPVVPPKESFMAILNKTKEIYIVPDLVTGKGQLHSEASIADINALALSIYPLLPKEKLIQEDVAITAKQKALFLENVIQLRRDISRPVIQTDPAKERSR